MQNELQSQLVGQVVPQRSQLHPASSVPSVRPFSVYNDPGSLLPTRVADTEEGRMPEDGQDRPEANSNDGLASELNDIDALVRNYGSSILCFALSRVRDRDLAETVTQDCLMRAFRSRDDFQGGCSIRSWLFTIATNLIRDHTRTKRFRFWKEVDAAAIALSDMHDRVATRQRSPEADLLMKEQLAIMWSVVDSLPKRQKEVLLMRFTEEMKLSEIACATGMTLSAIKNHLYRGVHTIRRRTQDLIQPDRREGDAREWLIDATEAEYESESQELVYG